MLSRTANDLYWMSRYVERAENMARILDVAWRMSLVPTTPENANSEWSSAITIAGGEELFRDRYETVNRDSVIDFIALDADNPSSILTSLRAARENARAVRAAITTEMWESLNASWLEIRDMSRARLADLGHSRVFDWVKERSHLFRGVAYGTMLRDDAFQFTRLGSFIERADATARILDVKYHILLPSPEAVGGATDYYQWSALLRSVSAMRIYRRLYRDTIQPWQVAELLTLRPEMPRSLNACLAEITTGLDQLAEAYGARHECHRLAGEMHAGLRFGRIDDIIRQGLHEYLTRFLIANNRLGAQLADDFLLTT